MKKYKLRNKGIELVEFEIWGLDIGKSNLKISYYKCETDGFNNKYWKPANVENHPDRSMNGITCSYTFDETWSDECPKP